MGNYPSPFPLPPSKNVWSPLIMSFSYVTRGFLIAMMTVCSTGVRS